MKKKDKKKTEYPKMFGKYSFGNMLFCTLFTSFPILIFSADIVKHAWDKWGMNMAFAFGFIFFMLFLTDGLTLMHRDNIEYLKDELDKAKAEIEELKKKLND